MTNKDKLRIENRLGKIKTLKKSVAKCKVEIAGIRLRAAAPDMFAVCKELVFGDGSSESLQRALDLANEVLR